MVTQKHIGWVHNELERAGLGASAASGFSTHSTVSAKKSNQHFLPCEQRTESKRKSNLQEKKCINKKTVARLMRRNCIVNFHILIMLQHNYCFKLYHFSNCYKEGEVWELQNKIFFFLLAELALIWPHSNVTWRNGKSRLKKNLTRVISVWGFTIIPVSQD